MATLAAGRQMSTLEVALRTFGARLFEAAPGLVTWILLLAPAWIPIIFPWPGAFVVAGGGPPFSASLLPAPVSGVGGGGGCPLEKWWGDGCGWVAVWLAGPRDRAHLRP